MEQRYDAIACDIAVHWRNTQMLLGRMQKGYQARYETCIHYVFETNVQKLLAAHQF